MSAIVPVMVKLLVAMAIGYYLRKKNIFNEELNGKISNFIVNVTLPFLVIYSVGGGRTGEISEIIKLFLTGLVIYAVLPLFAFVFIKLMRAKPENKDCFQLCLVFANVSFMGLPVLQAIYGDITIFYSTLLNMTFNIWIFTYGVYLLTKNQNKAEMVDKKTKFKNNMKIFLSPGVFSCIIALVIYFIGIKLPPVISESCNFIGGITTPLAMVVLGSILGGYPVSDIWENKNVFILSFIKLMVFPAIAFLLIRLVFDDPIIVGVVTISMGMPTASMCAMLGTQYGNSGRQVSIVVLVTTVLSMITIPIWYFIINNLVR